MFEHSQDHYKVRQPGVVAGSAEAQEDEADKAIHPRVVIFPCKSNHSSLSAELSCPQCFIIIMPGLDLFSTSESSEAVCRRQNIPLDA